MKRVKNVLFVAFLGLKCVCVCVQVNLLEAMENIDQETFEFRFGEELVYATPLSDGWMVELIPGGSNVPVRYEDRSEFVRLVQKARLEESKQQVEIRATHCNSVQISEMEIFLWNMIDEPFIPRMFCFN